MRSIEIGQIRVKLSDSGLNHRCRLLLTSKFLSFFTGSVYKSKYTSMFSVDINIIVFRCLCNEFLFRFHDPNNKLSL